MILSDLNLTELIEYAKEKGLPAFRGRQIFDGIYNGKSLQEISNIPKNILSQIQEDYPKYEIVKTLVSKEDGTKKYIFSFSDGQVVEGVLMEYKYGKTLCISTQVGCRMGCKFCASGLNGLIRNLTAGEILGQVLLVNKDLGGGLKDRKITNLVLMGSGEPLDNYENVTKFLKLVSSEYGLNISQRNISLSTCGLVPKIYKLADDDFNITLTISLHASNDEIRRQTMPIANSYSINEIIEACKYYFNKTGRRVVFEYTLIKGVNDGKASADELIKRLKDLTCHINVIPLNEVKERHLKSVTRKECYDFVGLLEKGGLSATVRRTMGEDISGACGQLRNSYLEGKI